MNIRNKLLLIWMLSLTTAVPYIHTVTDEQDNNKSVERKDSDDCGDHSTKLQVSSICAKKIKASQGRFKELCAEKIKADFMCTDKLAINHQLNVVDICAQALSTSDLCVSGNARINQICGNYRAWAQYSVNTTYTLGSLLNFDNIIDNPAGNLTTSPTAYTAPVAGYYTLTLSIHQLNLTPNAGIILGAPNAVLTVYINGVLQTQSFFPYLTFNPEQNSTLSSLLRLQAGDIVTATYNVLTVDPTSGVVNVAGTAVIQGGNGASLFAIHYLSSDCESAACTPCTPHPELPCNSHCEQPCNRE